MALVGLTIILPACSATPNLQGRYTEKGQYTSPSHLFTAVFPYDLEDHEMIHLTEGKFDIAKNQVEYVEVSNYSLDFGPAFSLDWSPIPKGKITKRITGDFRTFAQKSMAHSFSEFRKHYDTKHAKPTCWELWVGRHQAYQCTLTFKHDKKNSRAMTKTIVLYPGTKQYPASVMKASMLMAYENRSQQQDQQKLYRDLLNSIQPVLN
ncbi:hypothetical protein [Dongshaea marina]|uniref:hypothetical protein n=1 Tax=Dongshaea marina TaxID=2047966 RepID=UPI00131F00A8|nr:hypothetical protein [Dongshaea marina]